MIPVDPTNTAVTPSSAGASTASALTSRKALALCQKLKVSELLNLGSFFLNIPFQDLHGRTAFRTAMIISQVTFKGNSWSIGSVGVCER